MANNYIRPLLAVYQQLDVAIAATGDHLHACVIGPNYNLYRYGIEEDVVKPNAFSSEGVDIDFDFPRDPVNDYEVDEVNVNVYAENLEAKLAVFDTGSAPAAGDAYSGTIRSDKDDILVVRLAGYTEGNKKRYLYLDGMEADYGDDDVDLHDRLCGLGIEIEDIAYVTSETDSGEEVTMCCIVKDLVGERHDAVIGDLTLTTKESTAVAGTHVKVNTDTSAYGGTSSTVITARVKNVVDNDTKHSMDLEVTDTAGLFRKSTVHVSNFRSSTGVSVKLGTTDIYLTFIAPDGSAAPTYSDGDVLAVPADAAFADEHKYDGVMLTAAPVSLGKWDYYKNNNIKRIEFRKRFTGDLERTSSSDSPWEIDHKIVSVTGTKRENRPYVKVKAGLQLDLSAVGRTEKAPFVDDNDKDDSWMGRSHGALYVSYRVLVKADPNEDIFYIDSEEDIKDYFGTISQENELAYAAYWCLKGSQGRPIYALRTRGTDVESFHAAIVKTETMTETYSIAVISDDPEVVADIVKFNDSLSQPEVKRWRRTLCGLDNPGTYMIANRDLKEKQLTAKIAPYGEVGVSYENTLMQMPSSLDFDLTNIRLNGSIVRLRPGDQVRFEYSGVQGTIKTVMSSKELLLAEGLTTTISEAEPISIWKSDTATNNIEYVTAFAEAMNSRRVTVVWCDKGVLAGSSDVVENKFIAAEVAGISSAVVPQAGITRTEVQSVTNAVNMYTKYRQDQLDDIASKGVMIITQDSKGAPCYIRHQLTTEMDKGALYYEESPTRNLDNISYAMVDILEKYIGRANVTPSALTAIKLEVISRLNLFMEDSPDPMIGPSLINWDSLEVVQDPKFKDRIIIRVHLYLPLPLNGIRLYEMAYAADVVI